MEKKKSIGVYDFEDHQLPNLRKVIGAGLWYKFPDLGYQTPGDAVFIKGDGWVALYWYLPRKIKLCTLISIQDFDKFIEESGKKSIRQQEAQEIASYCFALA